MSINHTMVRNARLSLGLTLSHVSDLSGITRGKISNYEKGKFKLSHEEEISLIEVYKNNGVNFNYDDSVFSEGMGEIKNQFGDELAEILSDIFDSVRTSCSVASAIPTEEISNDDYQKFKADIAEHLKNDIKEEKDYGFFGDSEHSRVTSICKYIASYVIADVMADYSVLRKEAMDAQNDNDLALLISYFDNGMSDFAVDNK